MNTTEQFHPLPVVPAAGKSLELGRSVGIASNTRIAHSLATYRRTFELCGISWQQAIDKAAGYREVIARYTPHLLEELQGLAEGSSESVDSLLALNCRTEILPPDFLIKAMASGVRSARKQDTHANECTSFAFARANAPIWLAQNWDWVALQREALIVLQARPENGPAFITVTEAGMLAKIGINETGFCVSLNILRSKNDGQKPGMPVHFLLRALLDCSSVEEACEFATSLPYASSSNIMIADSDGNIASLELSPGGCRVLQPDANQICHTNHFLDESFSATDAGRVGNISTEKRLTKVQSLISGVHDFDDIKRVLSNTDDGAESICRFADASLPEIAQIETIVAVAMNLTDRKLFVSAAQPSVSDFSEYGFG